MKDKQLEELEVLVLQQRATIAKLAQKMTVLEARAAQMQCPPHAHDQSTKSTTLSNCSSIEPKTSSTFNKMLPNSSKPNSLLDASSDDYGAHLKWLESHQLHAQMHEIEVQVKGLQVKGIEVTWRTHDEVSNRITSKTNKQDDVIVAWFRNGHKIPFDTGTVHVVGVEDYGCELRAAIQPKGGPTVSLTKTVPRDADLEAVLRKFDQVGECSFNVACRGKSCRLVVGRKRATVTFSFSSVLFTSSLVDITSVQVEPLDPFSVWVTARDYKHAFMFLSELPSERDHVYACLSHAISLRNIVSHNGHS